MSVWSVSLSSSCFPLCNQSYFSHLFSLTQSNSSLFHHIRLLTTLLPLPLFQSSFHICRDCMLDYPPYPTVNLKSSCRFKALHPPFSRVPPPPILSFYLLLASGKLYSSCRVLLYIGCDVPRTLLCILTVQKWQTEWCFKVAVVWQTKTAYFLD